MTDNPAWAICERVAEVQALLHDHAECGKHTAADVVAKAQAVLSEPELLRAMFDVGYFPPNTPPEIKVSSITPQFCLFAESLRLLLCRTSVPSNSGGARMEYQGFVVDVFERDPGKWRAELSRSSGRPLITGRKRIWQFVTGIDATTAQAALLMALEAIDAGTFTRAAPLPEKFWRGRRQRSNAPTHDDRSIPAAQRANQNRIVRTRSRK